MALMWVSGHMTSLRHVNNWLCLWHHFEIQSHGTALRFDQAVYDQAWKIFHDKQVQFNNITNIEALNLKKFLKYSFPG